MVVVLGDVLSVVMHSITVQLFGLGVAHGRNVVVSWVMRKPRAFVAHSAVEV
jgi:hypothetical protein